MSTQQETRQAVSLGIIGGTGLYQLDGFDVVEEKVLPTPWGEPSAAVVIAQSSTLDAAQQGIQRVAFLARHGKDHTIAPHKVNYRANIWALKELGVKQVIAVAAVGGISEAMAPETVVIPEQIIDYTYGRKHTYFEQDLQQVTHIDFTEPYSKALADHLAQAATHSQIEVIRGGVYAATQGPRLETAAEIQRLRRDGADIVGMTGMPEAALAREAGLDYACLGLVVNWAAGCAGTRVIDHDEMFKVVDRGMLKIKRLLRQLCSGNG